MKKRLIAGAVILTVISVFGLLLVNKRQTGADPMTFFNMDRRKPEVNYAYRRNMNGEFAKLEALGKPDKTARATITFTRPLSVAEKDRLKNAYKIQAVGSNIIYLDESLVMQATSYTVEQVKNEFMDLIRKVTPGVWVTSGAGGSEPQESLEFRGKVQNPGEDVAPGEQPGRRDPQLTFVGLSDLQGFVPVSQLRRLSQDDSVFLVDVSFDEAFTDAQNDNPKAKFAPSLFWEVARLGLTKDEKGGGPPVVNREAWLSK